MLRNESAGVVNGGDPMLKMIASISGRSVGGIEIIPGIFQIGHFGSSYFLASHYEQYPELPTLNAYGVCDNYQQILDQEPMLVSDPDRQFIITLTWVNKADEESPGGWRWHKWGPYIGTHKPQYEYIADEEGIEGVYVYHIYEYKGGR